METPLINVLIRTSNRPELFKRAVDSVKNQTHKNINIIVSYDSDQSNEYTGGFRLAQNHSPFTQRCWGGLELTTDHYWNLYCNKLKSIVKDGWFFFLDDDDYLYDNKSLERISKYLVDPDQGVICQFMRNGKPKPKKELMDQERIECGRIGAPSLFLHHSKKDIANWDGQKAADYRWIKNVSLQIPMKFVQVVVVQTGNNGLHGK